MMKIDLHVHSIFSDGENTPQEILKLCKDNDINVVSITDHNNIDGVKEAIKQNSYSDIRVIPGLEFSAQYPVKGGDLHILGYNMDLDNIELNSVLKEIMKDSVRRIESLLYQLKKNYNMSFKDSDIEEMFSVCGNIGRPDVAKLCVKYGYAPSVDDAFDKFLNPVDDKLVKKKIDLTGKECIEYIKNAGGITCLAHPITLKRNVHDIKEYVKMLMGFGLEAVEVYHSTHDKKFSSSMQEMVDELGILYSVGSDYHGYVVKPKVKLGSGINNNLNFENATILSKILRSD